MPLANFEHGIIEFRKMDYLLDEHHDQNNGKARLFYALGYTRERWDVLAEDLRSQHLILDAVEVDPNPHGRKFEIVGLLRGPRERLTLSPSGSSVTMRISRGS